ncbi:MAG TPA: hypothetical protein DCE33_13665, partial [Rhodospirillaceae bacterium]|nr:hypothetical protein [Rhodospirillaceae bacterium]
MEVYRNLSEVPDRFRGGAVVLGNFDGVHRGHQAVIGKAATAAKTEGQPLGVVTFDPHPR